MGLVKRLQLFMGKIRDTLRVTATVVVIGGGGVEIFTQGMPKGGWHRTHGALHFIKDYTFIHKWRFRVVWLGKLYPVAFLSKI